jgi:hypothetical protein
MCKPMKALGKISYLIEQYSQVFIADKQCMPVYFIFQHVQLVDACYCLIEAPTECRKCDNVVLTIILFLSAAG